MKSIIIILVALCSTLTLSAQQLKVKKSESAEKALTQIDNIRQPSTVMGYRVGIFFDNGQDARSKANEAKALFTSNFPTQPVYMVYESPYYKVSAGDCLTEEEAIMLFESIRKVFPNAFVMREKMDLSNFTQIEAAEAPAAEALDTVDVSE